MPERFLLRERCGIVHSLRERHMTPWQIALLVAASLAVFGTAIYLVGRASAKVARKLRDELIQADERALLGPEPALYSGATARFSKVRGNCVMALTERRLLVRMLVGRDFDLDRSEIVGVHDAKTFDGQYQGRRYLVVDLKDATQVGFQVRDLRPWKAALGETPAAP